MSAQPKPPHVRLDFISRSPDEMAERAADFADLMSRRRTVRDFADRPVPRAVIENCIRAAGSAPSGANQQPWRFVAISDASTKARIRQAAEAEERAFYGGRAGDDWLDALAPFGTDANKPFLQIAPWLIMIFAQRHGQDDDGKRVKHYYVPESVGIATGFLITALHNAGLATLTHTPAPMSFLSEICGRPDNERPVILLVAGYPSDDVRVPAIERKSTGDITTWLEGPEPAQ